MQKKKTIKKITKKSEKVALNDLVFLGCLNFVVTLVFGLLLLFQSQDKTGDISKIEDNTFFAKLYAESANENAKKAREFAFYSKLYSQDLYEQSQKKAAKK